MTRDQEAMIVAGAAALQRFNWDNYGLDSVADADPEWTHDAAAAVLNAALGSEIPVDES